MKHSVNIPGFLRMSILLLLMFMGTAVSGQSSQRKFISYTMEDGAVIVNTSDGYYRFLYYTPEIVEASFIPEGETFDPKSFAVILDPAEVDREITSDSIVVRISTTGIDIQIRKIPFDVSYYFNEEKVTSEKAGYIKGKEFEKISFDLQEYEILFGGGARALGMDRRGHRLKLYNQAHYGYGARSDLLNYSLPIVLSSEKYMLHFDNAPIGYLDLDSGNNNTLTYETTSGRKTYQLIVGETWENIISNYTLLTGRQPLPPRWIFGNFSSRFGYHSQEEVLSTIEKFREEQIPVDAVIIDLFWFGHNIKGTMGNLRFVRDSFPQPRKMISQLADQGVKTVLVTEPFILTTSNRWEEAVREEILATDSLGNPFTFDFYFGNTGLIDIFKPKARKWFWGIYKNLAEMGVTGFWGDLGEPEVHPSALQHVTGSADEVHNIYGHFWAKMIYQGYQEDFPNRRPFILMRAGAAGSQRYGLIPWSGDVSRSWGGLKSQPEISLQMGLQGLAYMHSDLGGFAGNNVNNELYVRWLQYGVFQPVFRPHSQESVPSEPVFKDPITMTLAKKAIELRYRLLPYNYTLAFKNSRGGIPLMRPLFFEEPDNYRLYHVSNTYLWGKDFLVSAVFSPVITEKEIYFPGSSNWYDFYTGKKYSGGTKTMVKVEMDHIPTFVRGGAFIAMAEPVMTTANYAPNDLDLHYYHDNMVQKSKRKIYHDDGLTPGSYKNGSYEILHLQSEFTPGALQFTFTKEVGKDFESQIGSIDLFIHNSGARPEGVSSNKGSLKFIWDEEAGIIKVSVPLTNKINKLNITY